MRLWSFLCVFLISLLVGPLAYPGNWVPSGEYGYVTISNADGDWYTWKTERGKISWGNSIATVTFSESASNCPNSNYCKESDSGNVAYTILEEKSVKLVGENVPIVFSDDESILLFPMVSSKERGIGVGVKPSSSVAPSGEYYLIAYERDLLGGNKGQHRLEMGNITFSSGTATKTSKLACDGPQCENGIYSGTDQDSFPISVGSDGKFLVGQDPFGWVGSGGKVAVISNTGVFYPDKADDFMIAVALKKGDKEYGPSDLAGNWVIAGFGDEGGEQFSFMGNVTCGQNGACTVWTKNSSGEMEKIEMVFSVSETGSINDFEAGPSYDEVRGVIGNNGQTMILARGRTMVIGVKTPAKINLTGVLLKNGWNLVGLIGGTSKSIGEIVGQNYQKIVSIWKWVVDNQKWAVYLPKQGAQATSEYAQSKGFDVIDVINPGEGFWVNVTGLEQNQSLLIE